MQGRFKGGCKGAIGSVTVRDERVVGHHFYNRPGHEPTRASPASPPPSASFALVGDPGDCGVDSRVPEVSRSSRPGRYSGLHRSWNVQMLKLVDLTALPK